MRGLLSWKAEHVVLAGPFHRQVGEACNPHAVRESTLNGGPNEVRCKERQGQDLPTSAALLNLPRSDRHSQACSHARRMAVNFATLPETASPRRGVSV